ncbi:hypothetical protein ATCCBAA256_10130 [Mycobacterium montefiorense]|nr:hypothetical protein ATCCBAA256_10130 [Mycobacterium montefiorense]
MAGTRPDEGERLALRTLQNLCDEIAAIYAPGARLTICSDGHVFADIVGVCDGTVTVYKDDLARLIQDENLCSLNTFDLQDMWGTEEIETSACASSGDGWARLKASAGKPGPIVRLRGSSGE